MGDSLGALVAPFKNFGVTMKRAANFIDRNQIKRMAEEGMSSAVISENLKIDQTVVENFMPPKPKKVKAKEVDEVSNDAA